MSRRKRRPDARLRPRAEGLEGRQLLYATIGGAFAKPARVTYSFVPDGTSVGGTDSNLNARMDARFSRSVWQEQFRKAAALWASVSGVDLVEVPDNGAALGSTGYQQGDPRFGDIRIAGFAQSADRLAFAFAPPPFNGGTLAGDVVMNTAQAWQVNSTYDLFTVAVHEFGHALGLDHSTVTPAVQFAYYNGTKSSLTTDDTSGIRAVYGAAGADSFEAAGPNNTYSTADDLSPYVNYLGQVVASGLYVSGTSDPDWYKIRVPYSTDGRMVVTMQSEGLSSLKPSLTIYDASLRGLAGAAGTTYGDEATIRGSVWPGQVYYIRAMPAVSGAGSAGAYALRIEFNANATSPVKPPNTTVASQPDQNPKTYADGEGWYIDGKLIPFRGERLVLPDQAGPPEGIQPSGRGGGPPDQAGQPGPSEGLFRLDAGGLAGYGEEYLVSPRFAARHGAGRHPRGPMNADLAGRIRVSIPRAWRPIGAQAAPGARGRGGIA
jgi:hypothetical protein